MPGRPEEHLVAGCAPDVGVAGGIAGVVGLGLDDDPRGDSDRQAAADQIARDLVHGAIEELPVHARRAVSASRARSSCSSTRAEAVPPAETFDSIVRPAWSALRTAWRASSGTPSSSESLSSDRDLPESTAVLTIPATRPCASRNG